MIKIEDNDAPIDVAKKLIYGTKNVERVNINIFGTPLLDKNKTTTFEGDMFTCSELKEIASYLLTYCKYNSEENND